MKGRLKVQTHPRHKQGKPNNGANGAHPRAFRSDFLIPKHHPSTFCPLSDASLWGECAPRLPMHLINLPCKAVFVQNLLGYRMQVPGTKLDLKTVGLLP
eukprot:3703217-Amphidinium_carterae.1